VRKGKLIAVTALLAVLAMQGTVYAATVTKVSASVSAEEKEETALREEEAAKASAEETAGTTRETGAAVEENEPPTRIYVSKGKKELTLYVNHQVIGVWACNIGTNSDLGKKQVEGDRITPSGEYYICLRNPKSNYHLSLGLSYPDKSDADRGFAQGLISEAEKDAIYAAIDQGGCPPWKTALGGYVMIHGNYTENFSTAGCVAVPDSVMDILWQYVPLGTKVTIGA